MAHGVHNTVVLLDGKGNYSQETLGSKGYGINVMRQHHVPVPPAFCLTTDVGARHLAEPEPTMHAIWSDVLERMNWLEAQTSRTFGRGPRPLLVSLRSGAGQSMPGMMDTILNLGMNDSVEKALASTAPGFAHDTRHRFANSYQRVVGTPAPNDPYAQLRAGIDAVFASWNSPRAIAYRAHQGRSECLTQQDGTAVVVQAMVFGNYAMNSGAGVLFSRNPILGSREPFGEWLPGSQGDTVVSGLADTEPIMALRNEQPNVYNKLIQAACLLERLAGDVQEIEFTVENGELWLLQTRVAERSAPAAIRLALQLRNDGLIDDVETLRRVTPEHVATVLRPMLQPEIRLTAKLLAQGLPACPGVARGTAYLDIDSAIDAAERGEEVILVRGYTKPEDIQGMLAAQGIITEIGGATSHAAVVSRELNRVAVVGCGHGVAASLAGKQITVDGYEGEVREGILPLSGWSVTDTTELLELADIVRQISLPCAPSAGDYPRPKASNSSAVSAEHIDALFTMLNASQT